MEIAYILGTILSGAAAVLAWLAKIYWSKEYISAKDEIIKAKEAQIEQLKSQVQHYKDLTPMKIREYFESMKEQLEEYNDSLQRKLENTKDQLEKKNEELKKLEQYDQEKASTIANIKDEKEKLEEQVSELETDLEKLRINEEEFNTIKIPKIDTSAFANAAKVINESMNESLGRQLAQISNSMEYLKGITPKLPLETDEEKKMALWFLNKFEDPANSVPYESKEGGYQYKGNEPYNAREVLSEKFQDVDQEVIESVVDYLEGISLEWVKKDRFQ